MKEFFKEIAMSKAKRIGAQIFRPTLNSSEEFIILLLGIGVGLLMIPILTYKVIGFIISLMFRYILAPVWNRFTAFLDGRKT